MTLAFSLSAHAGLFGLAKRGLILLAAINLWACAGLVPYVKSWKEEVQLHDGRVIVVERLLKLNGYPTLDAQERAVRSETVTFSLPGSNKRISWQIEYRDDVPEPNGAGPLLLDVVGGVPYLATSPAGCIAYNKWGRPNPPYILFKYINDAWQRIALEEFPPELVHANLMSTPDSRLLQPYYTLEQVKAQMQGRNIADAAKTILREAMPNYGKGCGEMVYNGNGGWIGKGFFRKQPSSEACLKYCEQENISTQYCPCDSIFRGKK